MMLFLLITTEDGETCQVKQVVRDAIPMRKLPYIRSGIALQQGWFGELLSPIRRINTSSTWIFVIGYARTLRTHGPLLSALEFLPFGISETSLFFKVLSLCQKMSLSLL
ncbi:hypothetical protein AHAS_Ahas10G0033000 [Arachis hypogaea]